MTTRWRCISLGRISPGFTLNRVYTTSREGRLIDDVGDERLRPEQYNRVGNLVAKFKKISASMENK